MNLSLWQQTKPVAVGASLVMAISKKSAPTVILHSFELPGPYTGQTQLHTFSGIDDVMWYFQCFESPDGTPTGTVRNYFDTQPNVNTYATRDLIYMTADVTANFISGMDGYGNTVLTADTSLVDWNWYLERKGQGTQEPGIAYIKTKVVAGVVIDTTIDDMDATGFRLAVSGDLIGPNEEWIIHFYPQLQAQSSPSTGTLISATRILTANTTLDSTAIGQSFWLKGAAGYFEITLPDASTVPDNEPLYFMSDGGMHVNVGIKCFTGQTFQWYKNAADLASDTRATRIVFGQQEKFAFYKTTMDDSSVRWLMLYGGQETKMVGEIIYDYSKIPHNTILADGRTLSKTTYVRLWEWVNSLEGAAMVAAGSYDAISELDGVNYFINHGKFSSVDSSTFRVPTLLSGAGAGIGFLRMVDGTTRTVASHQADGVPDHQHEGTTGTLPSSLFGKGSSRTKGNYNGIGGGQTDLTGKNGLIVGSNFQETDKSTFESRPVNVGVYGLIRI